MFKKIVKRDGKIVDFNLDKITDAIAKAGAATEEFKHDRAAQLSEKVLKLAEETVKERTPTVEQIQDLVEKVLMDSSFKHTAKAYITYRQDRNKTRNAKSNLMGIYKTIAIADASEDSDVKRSNANVDGNSAMGKMLQFGAEGSKVFAKTVLLDPRFAAAHDNGDIHIHDLDFYATGTLTCCQTDPLKLFANGGFNTGHGHLRTPNSIASYAALAAIILQANQNEQHGGQSIPNFDYAMAPGVNKSFRKALRSNLEKYNKYSGKKVDIKIPDDIAYGDTETLKKLKIPETVIETSNEDVEKQTFQAMEGFIHNLNTMHSRAGAQVPFTSINFGTDTTPAGRLVTKNLLEATDKGLGHGETPIFPISIFKVTEGAQWKFPQNAYSQTSPSLMHLSILNTIKRVITILKSLPWAAVLVSSHPFSQNQTVSSPVVATTHLLLSTLFALVLSMVLPLKNAKKPTGLVSTKTSTILWISVETNFSSVTSSKLTNTSVTSHSSWAKVTGLVVKNLSQMTPFVKLSSTVHYQSVSSASPKLSLQ